MLSRLVLPFLLLLAAISVGAQQSAFRFWADASPRDITPEAGAKRMIYPAHFRTVQVEYDALSGLLAASGPVTLEIPLPNGQSSEFEVWEAPVMHQDLQARYPEIHCFTGKGIQDKGATIKCDVTPWGFHAMIISPSLGSIFIDPYWHGEKRIVMSYFKKDFKKSKDDHFGCELASEGTSSWESLPFEAPAAPEETAAGDCRHRQYRLALSCTGEYANFHGGTKPLVLAAMNTSMNRVNGLYEKDFAVTMQIIPNNDTLIFLNSSTDPFSNNNGGTMLGQNQTTVTQRIGSANYDIGHVFSTGGGGIASLGSVCNNSNKAQGVTGGPSPVGDPFDIDYVAHEMGHQFGGNHTFNNSCGGNRNNATAMEPGSGSTIMAYAGICSPDVQGNSDDYFHAISIQEIVTYITTGNGNTCAVKTITGNTAPTVTNVPNYTIPKSTPFVLTAPATDADAGDVLTWCWEQMDNQIATQPPVATNTGGPLFRSLDPMTTPSRYFPRLSDVINNVTNNQWEKLPSVARTMNFRVVVRDNHPGGGCTAEDNVALTVSGSAGPFLVSVPNTNVTWNVGESKEVTWSVAGTNVAPVSCAQVRILLSKDGGNTYPYILAESVPNTGSATITVPDAVATTCRVKVESIGNVFYDISNTNFRIQVPPTPTFVLNSSAASGAVCAGENASFTVSASALAGFSTTAQLTVSGAPAMGTVALAADTLPMGGTVTVQIGQLTPVMAGTYPVVITAVAGSITQTANYSLTVLPGAPAATVNGWAPADSTIAVASNGALSWQAVDFATSYTVEISTTPAFAPASAVTVLTTSNTQIGLPAGLLSGTPYYWRVNAANDCGDSGLGSTVAFQTAGLACGQTFTSTNVPVVIDVNGVVNVVSNLNVNVNGVINDVNVHAVIDHTWVGDLDASLEGPDGTVVALFDRPGEPVDDVGCNEADIDVTFDDEAAATAETLENTCEATAPTISGAFQSIAPLSAFDTKNANGVWKLRVNDNYEGEDSGSIEAWSLEFCFGGSVNAIALNTNAPLHTISATTRPVTSSLLMTNGTAADITYTLLSLPASGSVLLHGMALAVGGQFTQADIDAGVVTYQHNGDTATADQFVFDIYNANTDAWMHAQVFAIVIVQNTLAVTAGATTAVACHNESNGAITVTATGGTAPLTYSLNGGTAQSSPVFAQLAAGIYTVVVTDANGFTRTAGPVTLGNPAQLVLDATATGNTVTLSATGGTGSYQYSLGGSAFQSDATFTGVTEGIYQVIVSDAAGCTATDQVVVSTGVLLALAEQTASIACNGNAEGQITVTAAGGVPPYTYSLTGHPSQVDPVFNGLVAGTYTATVTDFTGTTVQASVITVSQPAVLAATASVSLNVITVSASGGTGSYSYSLNGGAAQSDATFSVNTSGQYTVVATDANGCFSSATATVNIPTLAIVNLMSENPAPCDGTIGTLTVVHNGGVPPFEFRLDNGAWQNSNIFNNVAAGTHTIEVKDGTGTTDSESFNIMAPQPLTLVTSVSGNDAEVSAPGILDPLTYSLNGGTAQSSGTFENLPNGDYTVVATDINGCTAQVSFTIQYTVLSVTITVTPVSCFGANDGSIAIMPAGGTPPYSFIGPMFNLAPGAYTVTVTDALGDTAMATGMVTTPTNLNLTAVQNGVGTLTATCTGGTPPYSYSIDGGNNYQSSPTFNNVDPGNYTLTVRDAHDCTQTVSVIVSGSTEIETLWGVSLAPNPTGGQVRLTMHHAPSGTMQTSVLDITGRVLQMEVYEVTAPDFTAQWDMSRLPSGVYYLRLVSGQHTGALRVVKE